VLFWSVDLLTAEADLNIILYQSLGCNPRRAFHMSVTKLIELMTLNVIIVWDQNIVWRLNIELRNVKPDVMWVIKSFVNGRLTLRRLMSYIYIYGAPILDVSRSHTTTQHSR